MEDQGKRLLLAVGISMALVVGWQLLFPPKPKPPENKPAAAATAPAGATGTAASTAPGASAAPAAGATAPAKPSEPTAPACDAKTAHTEILTSKRVRAVFSECGGALQSWRMIDTKYTQKAADGKLEPLDLVARPQQPEYFPLQTSFPESTADVDRSSHWTLTKKSETELEASWRNDKLEVTKTFSLEPDLYA